MSLARAVTAAVRGVLGERRLTVIDLAHRLGRPKTTVYNWINDKTRPDVDEMADIAGALDLTVSDLIARANAILDSSAVSAQERAGLEAAKARKRPAKRGGGEVNGSLRGRDRTS